LKDSDSTKWGSAISPSSKNRGGDKAGLQAYMPADETKDKQLLAAINFLRTAQGAPAGKKPARAK
jgi:hypothetical protein